MEKEFKKIISNVIWMTQSGRNKEDILKISLEQINAVLPQANVIKSVCDHDVRNFKDRQECEKCGEVWIRQ